ncbi:hypothetical protein [Enterovibrio calviensis]|uniref:hypothetical protein n=1 Tax=Enterovibrio calviensis TaxID=91359 RepID=UPI000684F628|nr:hypothetical protein [Enterovibrio calviensis]
MNSLIYVSYFSANIIMTFVLIWGLKVIIQTATHKEPNSQSLLQQSISEKVLPQNKNDSDTGDAKEHSTSIGSFSRTAGAFGAMALAAATIGISYWLIYALFCQDSESISESLTSVGYFFLAGSALFAPYAFNQLSSLFKVG